MPGEQQQPVTVRMSLGSRPGSAHQVLGNNANQLAQHSQEPGMPFAAAPSSTPAAHLPSGKKPTDSVSAAEDTRYFVYLRLPFPRNGFVDPLPVDWDASKERALWKTMSRAKNTGDIDWNVQAEKYSVSVPFLLQQAAWLYERQLLQVKAQLRRVGTSAIATTSSNGSPLGTPRLLDMRSVSQATVRTTTPANVLPPRSISTTGTHGPHMARGMPIMTAATSPPEATPMSRTTSTATARPAPSQASLLLHIDTLSNLQIGTAATGRIQTAPAPFNTSPTTIRRSSSSSSTSSTASSNASSSIQTKSRLIRKRRPFRDESRSIHHNGDITDEDESPAFLPWGAGDGEQDSRTVTSSAPVRRNRRSQQGSGGYEPNRYENTSGGTVRSGRTAMATVQQGGTSSPDSTSSPRRSSAGAGGDKKGSGGNESSPSMGSSFSDLSDASVSQSALEEQYMSALGNGALGSRMSTISQAVRSRYF